MEAWGYLAISGQRQSAAAGRRDARPSGGLIDSQAVKTADKAKERGYDAGKKVKGRHRHILTDTLGLILAIVVLSSYFQSPAELPEWSLTDELRADQNGGSSIEPPPWLAQGSFCWAG